MNVQQTLRTLMGLPPRKSVLIESNHGLGKSSVVAQAAAKMSERLGKPFGFIDFRLAQCEVGDLIGMMRHVHQGEVVTTVYENGKRVSVKKQVVDTSVHDLAEWFPTDPDSCGFLFLDELTRAQKDVQNAVFELALDYRFHFHSLPMGWRVVSASNENMDIYSGSQMDPALYDRFLKIKFKPTFPEWAEYAEKVAHVHRAVLTYLTKFTADLGLDTIPEAGKTTPTPRSWIALSDVITYMADQGDDPFKDHNYLHLLTKGYIGDIATNFLDYIKKNYKVYNAEDILNKYTDELDAEFKGMLVTEIAFYSKELTDHIKKAGKLTKKQQENLLRFFKAIPKEGASDFWTLLSAECPPAATAWYRMEVVENGKTVKPVQEYTCSVLSKAKAMK